MAQEKAGKPEEPVKTRKTKLRRGDIDEDAF